MIGPTRQISDRVAAISITENSGLSHYKVFQFTLFESENERQKIEPVPIPLPRADVKTRNEIFFHNWTSEIIPFIHFGMQMDRAKKFF